MWAHDRAPGRSRSPYRTGERAIFPYTQSQTDLNGLRLDHRCGRDGSAVQRVPFMRRERKCASGNFIRRSCRTFYYVPIGSIFFAILKEGCGAGPIPVAEWYNRLSAAIQIRPLSRLNERRPIERMMQILAPQHSQLHLSEALSASLSTPERLVIWDHDIFSPLVRHRPETHDLALRACEDQRAPQALHTLTGLDLAQTGIAGRERHQFRPPQIQSRHFQRR